MTGIKIPVTAQFEKGDLTQTLQQFTADFNRFGQTVAQANKIKFTPITKASLDDMKKMQAQFEALRKVSGDLSKRITATGQNGSGFLQLDWGKLYPDKHSQNRQMQKAFEYVSGTKFAPGAPQSQPGGNPPGGGGGGGGGGSHPPPQAPSGGGAGRGIVGAGLNAMGPVGGVANGALSAGMSGGVMAGLAGLGGGLAALAIGKAIGAVVEKVGAAEQENIGYDKLKRTLGDVNVGFNMLKETLRASSYEMGVTFDEGQRIGLSYTKKAGLSGEDARNVGQEAATGGNFGRSFGLDPAQGAGFFAQMRAQKVTGNDQENRKLAMLIGEGIAKSGAFAKADEVLESIASYTVGQTRTGMTAANAEGYTAMLSGMVGSKMPGMDVEASSAMLSRMNGAITAGGAAGEAGQNFIYSALGSKGMDPIDVAILREQGMFGTGRKTFGAGTAYSKFADQNGLELPGSADSDKTNFEQIQSLMKRNYGDTPQSRKLMVNAMSNLYGINNSQAMAMSMVNPAQLGGMGNRLDRLGINVKDVNATGISRMAQIEGDTNLSSEEKDKRIRVAASEGQERTLGRDISDSKAAVENIKQQMADKLIPLTEAMRNGIMFMAGGKGAMSSRQIEEAMMGADSRDRVEQIDGQYRDKLKGAAGMRAKAKKDVQELFEKNRPLVASGAMTQEEHARQMRPLLEKEQEAMRADTDARTWHTEALKKEAEELERKIKALRDSNTVTGPASTGASGIGGGRGLVNPPAAGSAGDTKGAIDFFVSKGWSREQASGIVANLVKESGLRSDAVGDGGKAYGIAQWHPDRQAEFKKWAGKDIKGSSYEDQLGFIHYEKTQGKERAAGDRLRKATTAREAGAIVSDYYERPQRNEGAERGAAAERLMATVSGEATVNVNLQYPDGRRAGPTQAVPVGLVGKPKAAGQ